MAYRPDRGGSPKPWKKNCRSGIVPAVTVGPTNILGVLARVYVDDIDARLPLYQELTTDSNPHRFEFGELRLAKVGSFLLIQGADTHIREHSATIAVQDIELVATAIRNAGGELLEGPDPGPNGPRLVASHPDGTIIEYIQLG